MSFQQSLSVGKTGESDVALWLMARGCKILPVYEIAENQFKGPVFHADRVRKLVAPDLLVFGTDQLFWAEVKTKTAFTWHRKTKRFVTGIDRHHYGDYLAIQDEVDLPIWLFFYHADGVAKDSPPGPSGLFGAPLQHLRVRVNHKHDNHGEHGMVYWAENSLKWFADYPLDIARDQVA